jgi:arylsulfatase A-like enzyme
MREFAKRGGPRAERRVRDRVALRLALAVLVCSVAAGCSLPRSDPPDLLLITVDTLRADRLTCYGGEAAAPTLCGLGDRGVRYAWAFSAAPSTAPAIASILTSRYPSRHGVSQFGVTFLADSMRTLAEELREAGYATGAVVSNPVLAGKRGLQRGFDTYDARMTRRERNRPGFIEREASHTTDAALAWLAANAERPWFLWVHYQDPHGPYEPPGAPAVADADEGARLQPLPDHSGFRGIPAYQWLNGVTSVAAYERRYRDEIAYLDGELARLLAAADTPERALGVMLTSDHGEAFGEDDHWFAHGHSVGIEQARVPLLWRPPGGAAAPVVIDAAVSTIDIAPTLLRAAGRPVPEGFSGRPLVEHPTEADSGPAVRPLFVEHRLRTAVVAGDAYFARDHAQLAEPVADRITGGWLQPLPARSATLGSDGRASAYQDARDATGDGRGPATAAALSPLLDEFLRGATAPEGAPPGKLPDETRQKLEALGYLE